MQKFDDDDDVPFSFSFSLAKEAPDDVKANDVKVKLPPFPFSLAKEALPDDFKNANTCFSPTLCSSKSFR